MTTAQWLLIAYFALAIVLTPSDERVREYAEEKWAKRVANRILAVFFWVCAFGWAGFWS